LWTSLGNSDELITQSWPLADKSALRKDAVTLAIQINGKLRGQIEMAVDASREQVENAAVQQPDVAKHLAGATIRKIIIVPGKIVNVVV
jgi:leucyl-tRNA synthetase